MKAGGVVYIDDGCTQRLGGAAGNPNEYAGTKQASIALSCTGPYRRSKKRSSTYDENRPLSKVCSNWNPKEVLLGVNVLR